MTALPTADHEHWVGIDPGKSGAVIVINRAGTVISCRDMPIVDYDKSTGHYDVGGILTAVQRLVYLPDVCVGVEWPSARVGDGAQRMLNFGIGLGYLEMALHVAGLTYYKLPPQLWKGRLGLPGKTKRGWEEKTEQHCKTYYPDFDELRGPRGGFKDGRADALLIAHFLRSRSVGGQRAIVEQFGRGSAEAMALLMRGGGKRLRGVD
jgi:hypothetical protein